MKFSRYIVPIYIGKDYYGTGFIVNGMLITANHVVKDKLHSYFVFEGRRYHIDISKFIAIETQEDYFPETIVQDLFVCKTEIENSNLVLSSVFDKKQSCEFYGYSLNTIAVR